MKTLNRDHILAILTAHPDTWEVADVPPWLLLECLEAGVLVETPRGTWKLTEEGYRVRLKLLG